MTPRDGSTIHLRPAAPEDRAFMYGLAARLADGADLPWHNASDVLAFQHRFMDQAFARPKDETVTLIAEGEPGDRLGFVHAEAAQDSVTLEPCGYVSLLATTETGEGRGVARRLMDAVEDWARGKGFRLLGLDVFATNRRARAFYERLGYAEDSLRLIKPIPPKTDLS